MPRSIGLYSAGALAAAAALLPQGTLAFNPLPDPPGQAMTQTETRWRIAQRQNNPPQTGIILLDKPGTKGLAGPDSRALNPSDKGSLRGFNPQPDPPGKEKFKHKAGSTIDEKSKYKAGSTIEEKSKRKAGVVIEEKSKGKGSWKAFHEVDEKSKKPK